jgi:hypothetical protein
MTEVIFEGSADPTPTPSNAVDARMLVQSEWKSDPQQGDQSELSPREAARLIGKQRRERGEEDADPILERKYDGGKDSLSLREAASDLKFTHQLEHAIGLHRGTGIDPEFAGHITGAETQTMAELIEAGYAPKDAATIIRARNAAPQMGLVDDKGNRLERMDADHRVTSEDELTPAKAAHLLANHRRVAEAEHQQLLANLASVNEQRQQAEQQTAAAPEDELVSQRLAPPEPQQPDPVVEAERQSVEAARHATAHEIQLAHEIQAMLQHAAGALSDIRTPDDLAKVRATNPQRWQAIAEADRQVREKQLALMGLTQARQAHETAIAQHQRAQHQQAAAVWGKEQDNLFEAQAAKLAPEWRDPNVQRELRATAQKILEDNGMSKQQISEAWQGGGVLRSATAQTTLLKAAMWERAQARAKEITKAPLPPVVRPGTRAPSGAADYAQLGDLSRAIDRARPGSDAQLKAAARLVNARRRAGTL